METKLLQKWQIRIFVLCWVAYASLYFGRVNLSVSIPQIQDAFRWSKGQIGLVGTLFFWIYGIGQLINGNIGDKISSRLFVFIGLLGAGLANLFFGFSSDFVSLLVIWALNGYFQSILWGPIAKTLSYWYPYEKRGQVAIWFSTSSVGGYLLSWGLSGQIISILNWRWTFIIPGVLITLYSFIWLKRIKTHPNEVGLESVNEYSKSISDTYHSKDMYLSLWQVFKKTKLWFVIIACLTQGIIKDGIALWGPTMLKETHNLDMQSTTVLIMLIPLLNFGGMMIANLANKKMKNEKIATVILFAIGFLSIVCLYYYGHINAFVGLLFLGISSGMMYGANTLLLGVIPMGYVKYNKVSSVAGLLDFCSYLAAGVTSSITGLLVDNLGWDGVLVIWLICCVFGILALIISQYSNES